MIKPDPIAKNSILIVLLVALILRLCVPLIAFATTKDKTVFYTTDTMGYLEPAMNLLRCGQYDREGMPEIVRTPGYPIFLIPGLVLGRIELVTIAFQIILSCLTVLLVFQITLTLFERPDVSLFSAALYALEPLSAIYTGLLMTETLFTFLVMLSLYLIIRYLKEAQAKFFYIASLILAAAAYVRPVAFILPIVVAVTVLATSIVRKEFKKRLLIHTCIFLLTAAAPILAWQARNTIVAGYSGFSAQKDEFLFVLGQAVSARLQGISVIEQQNRSGWSYWNGPASYYAQHPEDRLRGEAQVHRDRGNEGMRLIRSNLWQYLQIHARGTLLMVGLTGLGTWLVMFEFENPYSAFHAALGDGSSLGFISRFFSATGAVFWGNAALEVMLLMYWSFAIYALFGRDVRAKSGVILLVILGAYLLLTPAAWPDSRFRHPVMPMMCVLAGYGLHTIIARIRGHGSLWSGEIHRRKALS